MKMKYIDVLAETAEKIFSEMTNTEVVRTNIKRDERLKADFAVAQVIEYKHLQNQIHGNFILGFADVKMAVLVATAIAENIGVELESSEELNEAADDILREFINTIVGNTISKWDKMSLPVTFGPPVSLRDMNTGLYDSMHTEAYLVVMNLAVSHIVLCITFNELLAKQVSSKKILVVDDSMVVRGLLVKGLKEMGFDVEQAKNGKEAVEKYETFHPELTIMDLIMPEMGGLEAILEIKQLSPECKVIILTSSARKDEVVTAKTLGVVDYVLKPVNMQKLVNKIREVLG